MVESDQKKTLAIWKRKALIVSVYSLAKRFSAQSSSRGKVIDFEGATRDLEQIKAQ